MSSSRASRSRSAARRSNAFAPAALLALLVVLATLQYHWTGQLGRAEEERARTSLNRAAAGLAADFDRELGRVFFFFLQASADDEAGEGLARRVAAWRAQPAFPGMLRQLLFVEHTPDGGFALSELEESSESWRPIEWPPELLPLRAQLTEAGEPGSWAVPLPDDVPALVLPVFPHGMGMRRFGPVDGERRPAPLEPEPPRRLAVLWLDTGVIRDRVLPALVDRHLGGEVAYRVEVHDARGKLLFAQGPKVAAGEPDVTMPLFRLPLAERFARHHAERHGGARMRVQGPFGEEGSLRGRWLLEVTHPAGSLAAAVARARWRNLTVSFLVLTLLGVAIGLVLVTARRAEALARRQIELVAGVSHELLTPVAAVRSAGENLAAGVVTEPAKVREYGELIVREGRRLGSLVEQVLTWAGLQARGELGARSAVDAEALVQSVVAACAGEAARAGVALEAEVAPGLPPVHGDRDALERALRNLVENALRHGASGGWVGVGAAARDEGTLGVVLAVEDRGPGPQNEDLPHLFEPFYRGRGTEVPGSGLGLALTRQIAEAHGGRVRVDRAMPHGARFTLELPGVPGWAAG
jgi:signal transduction histidine kinase